MLRLNGLILLLIVFPAFRLGAALAPDEFKWALLHPFAALKVKKITRACDKLQDTAIISKELDRFTSGGKADAFRHVFYMAAYAQKIKGRKLRKLGIAHEKGNFRQFKQAKTEDGELPDSLASVMDLYNNDVGIKTGEEHKKLSREDLSRLVIEKINAGEALIMKRGVAGNYLDCKGNTIDMHLYKKTWSVPKCLIASNTRD